MHIHIFIGLLNNIAQRVWAGGVNDMRRYIYSLIIIAAVLFIGASVTLLAQEDIIIPRVPNPPLASDLANLPGDLRAVPVPTPPNLNEFVKDPAMAIALGKALFWDMQVGSDGVQACASCHFRAGADPRSKNQVSPGLKHVPNPDLTYSTGAAPNYQLEVSDFPLTQLSSPGIRGALNPATDSNDAVSSQGIHHPGDEEDPQGFFIGMANTRRVEPRNTPSVINAVFNFRNFWDGRARNEFNGANPIGDLDPFARVLLSNGNTLQKVALNGLLRLDNASLASQAVGPALSDMEMSGQQRSFAQLGRKLLALPRALPGQLVATDDSVLGNNKAAGVASNHPSKGINRTYADLIRAAFQPRWHSSPTLVSMPGGSDADGTATLVFTNPAKKTTPAPNQFTQMEFNFSLFWGIAIQMYEATLRADDSPMDQAFDSGNPLTFSSAKWGALEKQGMNVFQGAGKCVNCHSGPETTNAAIANIQQAGLIEFMTLSDGGNAHYDDGFYNTAVRRCLDQAAGPALCDDVGIGATIGPLGLPLSAVRFSQLMAAQDPRIAIVCANQPAACNVPAVGTRVAVDGSFKTPGLRNIELTAPYMHNGGELTLLDTVDFYNRGGNFPEYNIRNLDADIGDVRPDPATGQLAFRGLGLSDAERNALVAFMKAMTDERVRFQRAPFDHPQLFVPNLPPDPSCPTCSPGELPAVGRSGTTVFGTSAPLPTFFQNLR